MNKLKPCKTHIALAIALALVGATNSIATQADEVKIQTTQQAEKNPESITEKNKILAEKRQQITRNAREIILNTQNALVALDKKDAKTARSQLQDVLGKLDILLAKHPDLKLIPADVSAQIYDLENSTEQVKDLVDEADDLLDDHKIQQARQILDTLISEIRITTVNIPLVTFPIAIKEAVIQIDANNTDNAKAALENVLGMLVDTTEVIALPVLEAESLLTEASELEHKSDLSKEQSRKDVLALTAAAKDKLKLAELLGYGSKEDYQSLYKDLDEISDVIHTQQSSATWNKIKQSIVKFKDKITRSL